MGSMTDEKPRIRFNDARIEMAHGAGGKASRRLIEELIAPLLMEASREPLGDREWWLVSAGFIAANASTAATLVNPNCNAQFVLSDAHLLPGLAEPTAENRLSW